MFTHDPIIIREIVKFLIPIALGCLSYIAATIIAYLVSKAPRRIYIGRLVFLTLFILLLWAFYLPAASSAFSGPPERYYKLGGDARDMGNFYGMQTTWIWLVLALAKYPRKIHLDKNSPQTSPNFRQ